MRFRLRTLLIALAVGPPVLALAWGTYREYRRRQELLTHPHLSGFVIKFNE